MFRFPNNSGFFLSPYPNAPMFAHTVAATANVDAAGESITLIGRITLEAGTGTKTISGAGGGGIYFDANTPTFANAGTTLRVGVQDVNLATGIEDGVFDVYKDAVGGTDAIISGVNKLTFTNGTKNITHGDLIAISFELTSRAGADLINLQRSSQTAIGTLIYPYYTQDTGAGPIHVNSGRIPSIALEFDDGTLGWIGNIALGFTMVSLDFSVNDTPDEYATVFTCPADMKASAWGGRISGDIDISEWEFIVYSDPLGTPQVEHSQVFNKNLFRFPTIGYVYELIEPTFLFRANTQYAWAIRPTVVSANFGIDVADFGVGNEKLRRTTALGENWALGTRTDQTGPFVLQEHRLPCLGVHISGIQQGGERTHSV